MDDSYATPSELEALLRALAREDGATGVSAAVRTRLLQEVRRLRQTRRLTIVKSSILLTVLFVATAVPIWQLATLESTRPGHMATAPDGELVTAFYPLEYSTVPMSSGRLIRMEVAPSALEVFGLSDPTETQGTTPSTRLLADVLVGDDGLARAVRFVRPVRVEPRKDPLR